MPGENVQWLFDLALKAQRRKREKRRGRAN
jgi:hypothetical protein